MALKTTTRVVARLGSGADWFPGDIGEVVAHTDGHWISVIVARLVDGRPTIVMREFPCEDRSACRVELGAWLEALGAEGSADRSAVREWSVRIAGRIVDGVSAR